MIKKAPEYRQITLRDIVPMSLGVEYITDYAEEHYSSNDEVSDDDDNKNDADDNESDDVVILDDGMDTIAIDKDIEMQVAHPETIEIPDSDDDDGAGATAAKKPKIQKMHSVMHRLIGKNTPIPTSEEKVLLSADAKHNITNILGGEHELARKNRILGTITFDRTDDMKNEKMDTDVYLRVDINGIIKATVKCNKTKETPTQLELSGSVPWDRRAKEEMMALHNGTA